MATVQEACLLRDAGLRVPVSVLSPIPSAAAREVASRRLRPSLSCLAAARDLRRAARDLPGPVLAHVELDTGLGRYGWPLTPAGLDQLQQLAALDGLTVASVYTHLSGTSRAELAAQLALFEQGYAKVAAALGRRPRRHALASSALAAQLRHPATTQLVRPGALLYGLAPC
ncbi:hypothetical protein GCM10022224_098380 [Nonomuraea antimicrobica]|uniref:Alanine racemase N-terminal domain-containing protein n=1 Tax=Nonomuraea antimicrobica TaxID=561173 RepID=A0ABP7EBW5_9ACTN